MSSIARGAVLPVRILDGYGQVNKFCMVPNRIAEELGKQSGHISILRVDWLDELSDLPYMYVAWNGSVDSMGLESALAIPCSAFDGENGDVTLDALRSFEELVMAEVRLVPRAENAVSVELLPISYQDWDIVSSRPGVVEDLLLRQMSLVEFGKSFKVQLDGKMEVSFQVSMLETASNRQSVEHHNDESEAQSDYYSPPEDFIALLNQHTFVSVVPLERPREEGEQEESEEAQAQAYEARLEELTSKCVEFIETASPGQPLSVLPSPFRWEDTSYRGNRYDNRYFLEASNCDNEQDDDGGSSILDDCLALLSGSPSEDGGSGASGIPSWAAEGEKEKKYGEVEDPRALASLRESSTTCLVHPCFLDGLLRGAVNSVLPDRARDLQARKEVLGRLSERYTRQDRSGQLLVAVTAFGSSAKEESAVILRLCAALCVRPGAVSLPPCALTAGLLGEQDGDGDGESSASLPLVASLRLLPTMTKETASLLPKARQAGAPEEASGVCLSLRQVHWRGSSVTDKERAAGGASVAHVPSQDELRSLRASFRAYLEKEWLAAAAAHARPSRDDGEDRAAVTVVLSSNLLLRLSSVASTTAPPREADYALQVRGGGARGLTLSVPVSEEQEQGQGQAEEARLAEGMRISECLEVASEAVSAIAPNAVQGGYPAAPAAPAAKWTATTSPPLGLEMPLKQLLGALLPGALPEAALALLRGGGLEYPRSVLLLGPRGSGKSTLVEAASDILGASPRTLAVVKRVDCRDLASKMSRLKAHTEVFAALSRAFRGAIEASERTARPCVLFLEDLHELCPAPGAGAEEGGDYDERAALSSLVLEKLLGEVGHRAFRASERAMGILAASGTGAREEEDGEQGREIRALQSYFRGAVSVVATCVQEQELSVRLCSGRGGGVDARRRALFSHSLCVPPVLRKQRISLLMQALVSEGCVMSLPSSLAHEEQLLDATEGLQRRDYYRIARRLLLRRASGVGGATATFPLACSAGEVVQECEVYLGASNSPTAGGATRHAEGTGWHSVGGLAAAKSAILDVLRAPVLYWKLYRGSPIRLPRGVLLYGPPGCGKTHLANSVAAHCGLQMISVAGPELLGKYIGSSEKAVRDVFARAHASGKPTLIFFDELEALAPKRGTDNTGVTDRVVNQLLTFLDGAEERPGARADAGARTKGSGDGGGGGDGGDADADADDDDDDDDEESSNRNLVYIMAATSRPDLIDKALLRPGRIERHLYLGQPGPHEREEILKKALGRYRTDADEKKGEAEMNVTAAAAWISAQEKAQSLVSADLGALVSTAFLSATHEAVEGGGGGGGIVLRGRHLLVAFRDLRPSLAAKDLHFFRRVHASFGQGKGPEQPAEPAASSLQRSPSGSARKGDYKTPTKGAGAGRDGEHGYDMGDFVGLPLGYVPAYGGSPLRAQYSSGQSPSRRQIVRGGPGTGTGTQGGYGADDVETTLGTDGEAQLQRLSQAGDSLPADASTYFDACAPQRTTLM